MSASMNVLCINEFCKDGHNLFDSLLVVFLIPEFGGLDYFKPDHGRNDEKPHEKKDAEDIKHYVVAYGIVHVVCEGSLGKVKIHVHGLCIIFEENKSNVSVVVIGTCIGRNNVFRVFFVRIVYDFVAWVQVNEERFLSGTEFLYFKFLEFVIFLIVQSDRRLNYSFSLCLLMDFNGTVPAVGKVNRFGNLDDHLPVGNVMRRTVYNL